MANLLSRMLRRGEVSRAWSLNQYLAAVANQSPFGVLYPPAVTYTSGGQVTERVEASYEAYTQYALKANPIIYGLVTKRALIFSEARFMWQKLDEGRPGDLFWTDDLTLLEKPWPNGSCGEMLMRVDQDVSLAGNAYVVREENRLRRLRPDWVQIVLTGDPAVEPDVDVLGYLYTPNGPDAGQGKAYLPDEIAHISPVPDPIASYRGMSWLTPVIREIQADQASTEHKLSFLTNGAVLGPVVTAPAGISVDQFRKFVDAAQAAHAGPANAGKMVFLAAGSDVKTISANLQQVDMKALTASAETRMTVAALTPAVIAGVSEGLAGSSLNAGNYQAAKRSFADGTLKPLWRIACAELETIVDVPDNARLWFDERSISFLRDDQQDVAQIQQVQSTAISSFITGGWKPDSARDAVKENDLGLLEHSGLTSVQLLPPGTPGAPGQPAIEGQAPDQGGEDYAAALEELRASRAALLDAAEILRATGEWSRRPHPGQRYRHGWIPASPLALRPRDVVDDELGAELDSYDLPNGYCRVVAREDGLTVESEHGDGVAIHTASYPDNVARWAQALEDEEDYEQPKFAASFDGDGATVRFGDLEQDLTREQAAELAQALRDLSYVVEDHQSAPEEPDLPEPDDETPIPDATRSRKGNPRPGRQVGPDGVGHWYGSTGRPLALGEDIPPKPLRRKRTPKRKPATTERRTPYAIWKDWSVEQHDAYAKALADEYRALPEGSERRALMSESRMHYSLRDRRRRQSTPEQPEA